MGCAGLNGVPCKSYVHILAPTPCDVTLFGHKVFADIRMLVREPEGRASWIMQGRP